MGIMYCIYKTIDILFYHKAAIVVNKTELLVGINNLAITS